MQSVTAAGIEHPRPLLDERRRRDPIARLIRELAKLPGIGEKTATRLAFHVLRAPDEYARDLAQALVEVKEKIRLCSACMNLTEQIPCALCADARRDAQLVVRRGARRPISTPSSAPAAFAAATTCCTACSRRSTASGPTICASRSCSASRRPSASVKELIVATIAQRRRRGDRPLPRQGPASPLGVQGHAHRLRAGRRWRARVCGRRDDHPRARRPPRDVASS